MSESTSDLATQPGDELLLELADDYLRRYRAGEQPTAEEYVGKHPELADRICELFPAMIAMEQPGPGATVDLAPPTERVGAMVGRYKLLERIGEGGFGVVFMAEQQHPVRRKVALKVVKPGMDSRQVFARFDAERQALAIMDHPNIAKVFDAGATDSGRPYFVMELVKGEPITEFCDRNQFPPHERLELFSQVCHAVQHAHQKGIIHRDIKPTNVLAAMHDTTPVVKVIDFGVAKALGQELTDKTLFTGFAQLLGTPLYMSPEQAGQSALDIDTRSDIYSLGVLLYELLTGTTPFDKQRFQKAAQDEIFRIIREEEPPTPSTRLSSLSLGERAGVRVSSSLASISAQRNMEPARLTKIVRGELDWIVMKALEKDRNRRYETANAFTADVLRYLNDEPVLACPPSAVYRMKKFVRRNKAKLSMASVIGAALLFAVGSIGWMVRDRTARHAKVAGQVELILAEVDQLQREQKWPEALNAARRAEAAVTSGDADAATAKRVREQLKDLEFIDRLEQIRMQRATMTDGKFDNAGATSEYARAFRDYGVDVEQLAVETSIDRLKDRPALDMPLAAALDSWANVQSSSQRDTVGWTLLAIARGIDPDPLRDRLRSKPVSGSPDELLRLAESIDIPAHHPNTLDRLASILLAAKHSEAGLRLLRDAQSAYPGDYWLNYSLGRWLQGQNDYEGAVRFYTAAVSIRPHGVAALNNLGNVLSDQGKLDESIAVYRRAIEFDPKLAPLYINLGARLCNDLKDYAGAIKSFRKAIEVDPKSALAYTNLGNALSLQGKVDESIAAYRKAIELDTKDTGVYLNLGGLLCDDLKDYAGAIESFRKAIELEPMSANAYSNLGIALAGQGKVDEAIAAYRRAIELDPKYAPPYSNLGIALAGQGKLDEAVATHRKAIELDPGTVNSYVNLGAALHNQGKLDEAITAWRKAIELDPKFVLAYINLGIALAGQGKVDEAVAAYRKAIELDPKDAEVYLNLGALLCDGLTDYAGAIESFRKAIELDPKSALAYSNLGSALCGQKLWDEAIAAYHTAVEIDPNFTPAYIGLGRALRDQGRRDEAIATFRKAIELDPKHASAYSNLGFDLLNQNKLGEAIAAYRQAIDIDPLDSFSHNKLAWLLVTCSDVGFRDPEQAVALSEKAVALVPQNADYWNTLGVCRYRVGDWHGAIAALQKSSELDRYDEEWSNAFFLAMAHWQLGNKDEAHRWYGRAVERVDRKRPTSENLVRFRSEAAELLGVKKKKESEPSSTPTQ